jgi:hypothetical protein
MGERKAMGGRSQTKRYRKSIRRGQKRQPGHTERETEKRAGRLQYKRHTCGCIGLSRGERKAK